MTIKLCRGIIS